MRPGICAKNMPKWALLVLFVLLLQPFALAQTDEPDVSREVEGGHSILLEQYTATWCDSCAVVDPWITDFVDAHSTRVVRVALHPDDHDPFGSPLTTHRIALKQADEQLQLPTFWFDGQGQLQGTVSQSLLENELRSAEISRSDWIRMHVGWNTWDNSGTEDVHQLTIDFDQPLSENATVTVFRIQTLQMTSHIANNGLDVHHDVATQMISFNAAGNVTHSFDGDFAWSISVQDGTDLGGDSEFRLETSGDADGFVTIIEEFGEVRGVTAIYSEENLRNAENDAKLTWFWPILALVSFSIFISRVIDITMDLYYTLFFSCNRNAAKH